MGMKRYSNEELTKASVELLEKRGVTLKDIGELVMLLQADYYDNLTLEYCIENIEAVLRKREITHAVLTGIALDELAEKKMLPEPIQSIIASDESLYGIDEIIPLSIVNIYARSEFHSMILPYFFLKKDNVHPYMTPLSFHKNNIFIQKKPFKEFPMSLLHDL